MWIAGGLGGAQRVRQAAFTIPTSPPSPAFDEAKKLSLRLEELPVFDGFHPTLPVQGIGAIDKLLLLNGVDRAMKYGVLGARKAFSLAPVLAPTVTVAEIEAPEDMGNPVGLVVEGDFLYVCDNAKDRVLKLRIEDDDLFFVNEIALANGESDPLVEPVAICTDGTHLYVTTAEVSGSKHRVVKYLLANLSYVGQIGSLGSGSDEFDNPYGICTDGTHLYVADRGNDRLVKILASDMTWVATYGTTGSGSGNFDQPCGVAYDAEKNYLWIADTFNDRIVVTDYLVQTGSFFTAYGTSGSGEGNFSMPATIHVVGDQVYVGDTGNTRIVLLGANGSSAPDWITAAGERGWDTDQYFGVPIYIAYSGGYLYVSHGWEPMPDVASIRRLDAASLAETKRWGPGLEPYTAGNVAYAFSYVDDETQETALSPATIVTFGSELDADIEGFHSLDPKHVKIRAYRTYLDNAELQDFYLFAELDNDPEGTTWLIEGDDADDEDLGDQAPRTEKRAGIHGLPPVCRVGTVWQDTLFMAGRVPLPDYSVGTATFAAEWDADHGLWKVTGSGTHWTERMVGQVILEADDEDKLGIIVWVDEEGQYLYLCTEWEGTTEEPVEYRIEDPRDGSTAYYSPPGLYEDVPATYFLPCDAGDGDDILAFYARGESLFVWKRNSVGVISGTSPSTYTYRKITGATGAQSPKSILEFSIPGGGPLLAFWSYPTIYALTGEFSEPQPFSTFIDPLLASASVDVANRCAVLRDEEKQVTWFCLGTEEDAANNDTYVFEGHGKSWSREPGPRMSATGHFRDRNGRRVPLYIDEWGTIWQPGLGDAEGAYAGDLIGAIAEWDPQALEIANSLMEIDTGLCAGVPVFLVDPEGQAERNLLADPSGAGHSFRLAWEPSQAPTEEWSFIIGGIDYLFETGKIDAGVNEIRQKFENLWIDHEETPAKLLLSAATDENEFVRLVEMDWSQVAPRPVALSGGFWSFAGYAVRFRVSSILPGQRWKLRGYTYLISYRAEKLS